MGDYFMSNIEHTLTDSYEKSVIDSALWAAYGDALGWMTELAPNISNVKYRTGTDHITKTMPWKRNISGKNGPSIRLPAGTYSDDTQLRLSVSRCIRGDGFFDIEAFAKIELPVWQSYALGAGIGSKAAALNLSKKSINWFSNFYASSRQPSHYIHGGGNGAAMRIQPHVWACNNKRTMLLNVFKDSIVTHGHVHGFCGALFHALSLYEVLKNRKIPDISELYKLFEDIKKVSDIVKEDLQLSSFWLPVWEEKSGKKLDEAIDEVLAEMLEDLEKINSLSSLSYSSLLSILGCDKDKFKGSGFKTALAATLFSSFALTENISIEESLIIIVNQIGTDTDTIATMVGALLGSICMYEPSGCLQDREYIVEEAKRLISISRGQNTLSFNYPDLAKWNPPINQNSSLEVNNDVINLIGLGRLSVIGERYDYGNFSWQWFKLPFGQTILAKFKASIATENLGLNKLNKNDVSFIEKNISSPDRNMMSLRDLTLDEMTDHIIKSNFDDELLGRYLNKLIDSSDSLELAIAFSAIIAKAKIARKRKART